MAAPSESERHIHKVQHMRKPRQAELDVIPHCKCSLVRISVQKPPQAHLAMDVTHVDLMQMVSEKKAVGRHDASGHAGHCLLLLHERKVSNVL